MSVYCSEKLISFQRHRFLSSPNLSQTTTVNLFHTILTLGLLELAKLNLLLLGSDVVYTYPAI